MQNEHKLSMVRPFGPAIGSTNIPKTLIDKVNNCVDEIIKDKNKSKKFDWGQKLVGEVTQEIFLPKEILEGELLNFFAKITKVYIENLVNKKMTKLVVIIFVILGIFLKIIF